MVFVSLIGATTSCFFVKEFTKDASLFLGSIFLFSACDVPVSQKTYICEFDGTGYQDLVANINSFDVDSDYILYLKPHGLVMYGEENGEDLMSRISYAVEEEDGLARLHRSVIGALNDLARDATAQAGLDAGEIMDIVIVGNSVMHHIILNLHPKILTNIWLDYGNDMHLI